MRLLKRAIHTQADWNIESAILSWIEAPYSLIGGSLLSLCVFKGL